MYLHLLVGGILACGAPAADTGPAASAPAADAGPAAVDRVEASTPEPWTSLSGSGLMLLSDASTLPPKRLNAGFTIENQDRDPTRLDAVDFSAAWTYGVRPGIETYGHAVLSRAVAVAERPTLLPPPLDLILPQGAPVPTRPYYPLYTPFPYVNRKGSSQVGRFVLGDVVLGGKVRLRDGRGWRPALAVGGEIKIPLTRALSKLQSGSGTGAIDEAVRVIGEWRTGKRSVVASLQYTHVGAPPYGDRLIVFDPGADATVTDDPLRLESRLALGLGFRRILTNRLALVAEATRSVEIGGHTVALEAAGPFDLGIGAQVRWSHVYLTTGLRFHINSVPPATNHSMSLGGLVDVTSVPKEDLQNYLSAIGASSALSGLQPRGQIVVAAPAGGPPLPPDARVVPNDFVVRSHDRVAYVFAWGWRFGGR